MTSIDSRILSNSMDISDVLSLMPLAPQPVPVHYEDFTPTQPTSPSTFALPPAIEMPTRPRANEAVARCVAEQSIYSAASVVMNIAETRAGAPEAQTFLDQRAAVGSTVERDMQASTNRKRTVGNAGFVSECVDGRNKMKGSQRKEVDNLVAGSYGQRVLSKLATELSHCCGDKFSLDTFDPKYSLNFQQYPQSENRYNDAAKISVEWSKLVKFCMMVDNHGDKECSGAPSKAMRSFALIFNGVFKDGEQTVATPFTTIDALQSHDLDSENGTYGNFIENMANELAKGVNSSIDIRKKTKNIEKDMKKCVRDIKKYTQRDTIIAMWDKWNTFNSEVQGKEDGNVPDNKVVNSDATDTYDAEDADDAEVEFDDPIKPHETVVDLFIDQTWGGSQNRS